MEEVWIWAGLKFNLGFPGSSGNNESACKAGDLDLIPGSRNPLEKRWPHTSVFLPGELYGERSLAGCSPWSHIESDMTENTGQVQMMTRVRIFNT